MVFAFCGISIADTIILTDTLDPFSTKIKGMGWKDASVEVGEFTFDQLQGDITDATISGLWSGKLGNNQHVYLYIGDYDDPDTWIQVADLYNPITRWRFFNPKNPKKANLY